MKRGLAYLLLVLAAAAPGISRPESLGRLFFTPEKRLALEQQRRLNPGQEESFPAPAVSLTINGRVRRSSGHGTTWVNERPMPEHDPLAGSLARLKPGETMDLASGERKDLLNGEQILVPKSAPPAR